MYFQSCVPLPHFYIWRLTLNASEKENEKLAAHYDVLLDLIREHRQNKEIGYALLRLLHSSCRGSNEAIGGILHSSNFVHIYRFVETQIANKVVVKLGLQLTSLLASNSDQNRKLVAPQEVAKLLFEISDFYSEDNSLISCILGIVSKLCDNGKLLNAITFHLTQT